MTITSVHFSSIPNRLNILLLQDVGAMRFPYIPPQMPLFGLFEYLGLSNKLIPYIMSNDETDILYFNGKVMTVADYNMSLLLDPLQTGVNTKEAESRFNAAIYPYKKKLIEDFDEGWKMLMKEDRHSMRTYLSFEKDLSEPVCVPQLGLAFGSGSHNVLHR
jgi:hypothetical protein